MSRMTTHYEPRVLAARSALENDPVIAEILSPHVSPLLLESFLIEWMARSPYMTDPIPGWVRKAGELALVLGQKRIGAALVEYTRREEENESPDGKNFRSVVRAFNERNGAQLDAVTLLSERPTVTMRAYRILHEEVLAADLSIGEVAMVYELERASSVFTLALLVAVQRVLGPEAALRLSAMRRRAPYAVERTAFLGRALAEILDQAPHAAEQLGELGAGALDIQRHFLRECVEAAYQRARAIELVSSSRRNPRPSAHV